MRLGPALQWRRSAGTTCAGTAIVNMCDGCLKRERMAATSTAAAKTAIAQFKCRHFLCPTTIFHLILPPSSRSHLPLLPFLSITNSSSLLQSTASDSLPSSTCSATASTSLTAPNATTSCYQPSFVTTAGCSLHSV